MLTINQASRLFLLGLLAALSVPACKAQETPVSKGETGQTADRTSIAAPSATLTEMALPKLPKVTCSGGEMTISADNSTLGSVLTAVRACLGIQVEIPEDATGSRVFEELGPGPARQVLESLLNGTNFNFVIGSSDTSPQKIETVLLMVRPTETASANDGAPDRPASVARRAWLQTRQNRAASLAADEDHPAADETPSTPEAEDAVAAPAQNTGPNPAQAPPNDQPAPAADAAGASAGNSAPIASPAQNSQSPSPANPSSDPSQSTEQKITDMQQLFQQRRQMNQSQNPASPQP